jgi:phosphatidylethanolamine-binding protein (PEBP) family uncharacterized protein
MHNPLKTARWLPLADAKGGAGLACAAVAATALAASGCGGSSTRSASTTAKVSKTGATQKNRAAESPQAQLSNQPPPNIELSSPAFRHAASSLHQLPREYTCDGADISPPLRWHGIPPDAAELVLFAINLYPANGKLFFDWSVAGINPKLGGLQAGRLPSGAVVGRNGLGHNAYSICPPGSAREQYVFVLFAPPKKLSAQPGFEPLALRSQILDIAPSAGLLSASYTH